MTKQRSSRKLLPLSPPPASVAAHTSTRDTDLLRCSDPRFQTPAYRYIRAADHVPTPEEFEQLPQDQQFIRVKLFGSDLGGRFFIASYDPATQDAYGVVEFHGPTSREYGFIDLPGLLKARGVLRLPIERDLHFKPVLLTDLMPELATLAPDGPSY